VEVLPSAQVALGRMGGGVAQEELYMLEGPPGERADFRVGHPWVVGRELKGEEGGVLRYEAADGRGGEPLPHHTPAPADRPDDVAFGDPSR
jgi:hypothetical protein